MSPSSWAPPTSATPPVSDISIPLPKASWLLFPGLWATNSAPVATVTPHPVRGSHQCHMDTTQQHLPSGPHHTPLALRFRASLPGQSSRCQGPAHCPHLCRPKLPKFVTPRRDTRAHSKPFSFPHFRQNVLGHNRSDGLWESVLGDAEIGCTWRQAMTPTGCNFGLLLPLSLPHHSCPLLWLP